MYKQDRPVFSLLGLSREADEVVSVGKKCTQHKRGACSSSRSSGVPCLLLGENREDFLGEDEVET